MSGAIAPVWRRLAAIGYDAFLLAALWMITAMMFTLASQVIPRASVEILMRLVLFCVGFAFFGWFWTHGGQTLGMRAWKVRVQPRRGESLPASAALLRYMAGLLPVIVALYVAARIGWIAAPIALAGFIPCFFDPRKRALHDLIAGTELVSAQGAQSQGRDQHEHDGRQAG